MTFMHIGIAYLICTHALYHDLRLQFTYVVARNIHIPNIFAVANKIIFVVEFLAAFKVACR